MKSNPKLVQIAGALDSLCLCFSAEQRRQQKRREDCNNGDYDKQLDQCKSGVIVTGCVLYKVYIPSDIRGLRAMFVPNGSASCAGCERVLLAFAPSRANVQGDGAGTDQRWGDFISDISDFKVRHELHE